MRKRLEVDIADIWDSHYGHHIPLTVLSDKYGVSEEHLQFLLDQEEESIMYEQEQEELLEWWRSGHTMGDEE